MARVVLIIEDDDNCAGILLIALEGFPGLEPQVAWNIPAALEAFEEQPSQIAAVVTDLFTSPDPTVSN